LLNFCMKVAVIGAGPAGLTAAYQLVKAGVAVEVFEAGSNVGGLAQTLRLWNQRVDLGPHRFYSKDRRVNDLWLEVVGRDYSLVNRLTRVLFKNRCFHYPLRPWNAFWNLGLLSAVECLLSYLKEKVAPTPQDDTFETWLVRRFGRRLFNIFFKTYSEKLWGISCRDLDSDFAAQRIRRMSLGEAIKSAFVHDKANKHLTLVDQFAYPHGGTGMVYERMSESVARHGGRVHLGTSVKRVIVEHGQATGLEINSGASSHFDHIISTMPLTLLVSSMADTPEAARQAAGALAFRNTILVYLKVEAPFLFPDNWIYIHSPELKLGRITNFRNWVPQLYGNETSSILALEFWCYDDDPIWSSSDEKLAELAKDELRRTGLSGKALVADAHVRRIKRCYPVYRVGYKDHLKVIEGFVRSIRGLQVIGRCGAFKYNNQDHSILMGLLAAENVLRGAGHNLWEINTDYSEHYESANVTETGLTPN